MSTAVDPEATPAGSKAGLDGLRPFLLTTLAYVAAGLAALLLAIPPGYGSPLYPATGIALASVLVYGWRMLGAVGLGAFCVNASLIAARGSHEWGAYAMPAVVGVAATLQAGLGALLIRRFVNQPLTLMLPVDVARFMAACAASSLVSASLSTAALRGFGLLSSDGLLFAWGTWWVGDLSGLLIATPIALTVIGRPASAWRPRRLPVGATLAFVTGLLAIGIVQVSRWNDERMRATFNHDASTASMGFVTQLQQPLQALEALRGVFAVNHRLSRSEVQTATRHWLGNGALRAMGWSQRVAAGGIAAFEAEAVADGLAGFRVVDRVEATPGAAVAVAQARAAAASASASTPASPPPAAPKPLAAAGGDVIAIRHIEPVRGNGAALGINSLSVPAAKAAVLSAIETGLPQATAAFPMSRQDAGDPPGSGIVVYQAVYDSAPTTPAARRGSVLGVVFVTLAIDPQLAGSDSSLPAYLRPCLTDTGGVEPVRLAGAMGCERAAAAFVRDRAFAYAGRPWSLRVGAAADAVPGADDRSTWIFATAGLLSAALLGAALLIVTGRTRRIESAVRERTIALRAEVGERHSAEAALRASEQRLRNIVDNVPIGVVYTDLDGRVIQANPCFCELTGYDESELAALAPEVLTHPDDVAEDATLTAQLLAEKIPGYRRHKRWIAKSGAILWVQATISLLRDAENRPWRIVGVVEDITEHLRVEDAERAREAAEASNQAKSEFLSRMSHELRTPLNAMLGFAQLLDIDQRNPLAPTQRPWVGQIQQAGWHLLEMINDVLDLSRIESGNLLLQTAPIEIGELVGASTALVAGSAADRGIRISEDLDPGADVAVGDATRVKQILTNLLSNAVKYNRDGGRVHVTSRSPAANRVEISVTDTGLGMTAAQLSGLFKPFNRLGREHTAMQGTGIGLVISQRLAELMGGSIGVKSLPGEGSSFTLVLPRAIDPDTVRDDLTPEETLPADYHRRLVHYVEDNETNVEVMRGILAQRPQVRLEVSMNGLDGLAAMRARRPHLLLLDMHLPDISGLELLRHLKAGADTADIPVVAVSADAMSDQIEAALAAGADRYLTKPVTVAEVLATLDGLLDRAETDFG